METPVNLQMPFSSSYNDMVSVEPQLFSERGNRRGGRGMRNRGRNQGGFGRGRGRGDVGQDNMDAGRESSFNDRMDGYIRGGQGRGRGQREGRGSRGRGRGNRGGGRRGNNTWIKMQVKDGVVVGIGGREGGKICKKSKGQGRGREYRRNGGRGNNDGVVVAAIVCTEEMKGGEILHRNKCPQLRCMFFVLKMKQYFTLLWLSYC